MTDLDRAIDLLANTLLGDMPPSVIAAGMVKACAHFAVINPELAYRTLETAWRQVTLHAMSETMRTASILTRADAIFLTVYFHHRGDWVAMEKNLLALNSRIDPTLLTRSVEMIYTSLREAATRAEERS